jgi:hypothetical protein
MYLIQRTCILHLLGLALIHVFFRMFIYARTPRQKEGGYDCDYLLYQHAMTVTIYML